MMRRLLRKRTFTILSMALLVSFTATVLFDVLISQTFHSDAMKVMAKDFVRTALDRNGPYEPTSEQSIQSAAASQATPTPLPSSSPSMVTMQPTPKALPKQVRLAVPFLVQAPFANWDALHEEACEEASMLMVEHFLKGQPLQSLQEEDKKLIAQVRYQEQNGYKVDLSLKQVADIMRDYYGISNARIETDFTIEDMKRELANGKPIIVPAYGKALPNPFFRSGGPEYHMLVITGYDEKGFISNDPGIRQGANFRYTYDSLYTAINNWDIVGNRLSNKKTYLVFDERRLL